MSNLQPMDSTQRAMLIAAPIPLILGLVTGLAAFFITGSLWIGLIVLVAVAAVVAVIGWLFADQIAVAQLGARPLADGASLQLRNQLDELCARTGVAEPALYTVGAGAPAIASVGRSEPKLVVTDGLSDELTIVELEGVVARELGRISSGATALDTVAVPFITLPLGPFGGLRTRALEWCRGADRDARCDIDGVAITRYPPGLAAALTKMSQAGARTGSRSVAHLWALGSASVPAKPGSYGVEERLELLSEL